MSLGSLTKACKDFWFTPVSPAPVCLFRIFYGILVLTTGLLLAPDLLTWFGAHPVVSTQAIHDWERSEPRFSLFFFFPESDTVAVMIYSMLMVAASTLTLGLFTRFSAFVVFICLCSLDQRMACIMNSGDTLLRLDAFLLIFSEAGALYSLDRMRNGSARNQPAQTILRSPWAQRLLQFQLAAVYAQTFCSKMVTPEWLNGVAFYNASRLTDFSRLPFPILFDHLWIYQLFSWMTLFIEFALCTMIWSKELRYPVLLVGTIFHLCIDVTMNIPVFEYIMIVSYINFLEPADVLSFVKRFQRTIFGSINR